MTEIIAGAAAPKLKAIERIENLLSQITYKPGWKIEVRYEQPSWEKPIDPHPKEGK